MKVNYNSVAKTVSTHPLHPELTQEDVIENGWTCKACDAPHVFGEVCEAEGDLYCWGCGSQIDQMDGGMWPARLLSTRAQVAELARWDAAGIGAN